MPKKTKSVKTYVQLVRMLGEPAVERRKLRKGANPDRVHSGWKWPCGCDGFMRPEGDGYMWVPCPDHEP